jgi:hypothetical protein
MNRIASSVSLSLLLLAATSLTSQAENIWLCGTNDNNWPLTGTGGGAQANFVQEGGGINPLPGSPDSTPVPQGADNDYYFAGIYTNVIASVVARYGDYTPVGEVAANEDSAERAFAGTDNDLRYHFNLPSSLRTTNLLTVIFDAFNLDTAGTDNRYGIEVYFNGVLVQSQIIIRNAQINTKYNTTAFTLASVNARTGPGFDNIVSLRGINYNADGGGNWMGIDYVQLDSVVPATLSITRQPQSVTTAAATTATFTVAGTTDASFSLTYQWKKGGVDIAGATAASYTTPVLTPADNGSQFVCVVGVLGANPITSQAATLTVTPDITRPEILGAKGGSIQTEAVLTFSERVSPASAANAANYKINTATGGALNVTAAVLSSDGTKVTLTTAQQTVGTKYVVTVNNVADLGANVIVPNSKTAFFPQGKITELNGLIVFEVENYDRNTDNRWIRDTTRGTPSGGASMVLPNGGGGSEAASKLEYDVNFKQAATYKIWYRASGNDGSDDSAWFHIDGDRPAERAAANDAAMTGFSGALDFVWLSDAFTGADPMSVDISAPGVHVVGLAVREDGSFFDKFILTTNLAYTPTGQGPPETREGGAAPPTVTLTGLTEGQTFPAGANITVSANASAATGVDMARVEFSANGTVIGKATQSPFTVTWNSVPTGNYTIVATATDEVGGVTSSVEVHIKVGAAPPVIYFVTADPGPLTFAGDIAVQQRLLKRGFDVKLARGSDIPANGSTALGSSLIVQSSSLGSGTVENADPNGGPAIGKFKSLAIPVLVWESSNEDAFGFQEANGTASAADQTQINIVDNTSPLAAGLPKGLVTVTTAGDAYSSGTPTGARIIATQAADPSQAVIYSYEKGDKGFNAFVMPARRVFFFFGDPTATILTADGFKLFDAAVDWLLGGQVVVPVAAKFSPVTKQGNNVILSWTGGGTLQSADNVTGPWTDVANASSPFTAAISVAKRFYRVKQ